MSSLPTTYDPDFRDVDINGTRAMKADPSVTNLMCVGPSAAHKMEGLRHLFCIPPLDVARPSHVKAFRDAKKKDGGKDNKDDEVVESTMWMGDPLLDLVHKSLSTSTQFHADWHSVHRTPTAEVFDEVVPLDNIVMPPSETIFPVINTGNDEDHSDNGAVHPHDARSPTLMRHARSIAPSSGHISGDYSMNTHDKSVPTAGESPRRHAALMIAAHYHNTEDFKEDEQLTKDQMDAKEREEREREYIRTHPGLFRWKLSVVRAASNDQDAALAFAMTPLSATSVHRCSVQVLSYGNNPDVPGGTSVLANGVFERPGSCFGIVHRDALQPGNSAKAELWAGMMWKCDTGATLPGAAMMVAVTNSGQPVAKLPGLGKRSENSEHYVRIGDVLTIETRPAPAATQTTRNRFALGTGVPPPAVSVHFFINNVEVFSWSNLAMLQPYCKAKKQQDDSDTERSPFNLDFMYFGVRLWRGTELGIVSGDPARIVGAA